MQHIQATTNHDNAYTCKYEPMQQQQHINDTKQMPMTTTHTTKPMTMQTHTHAPTIARDGHADVNTMPQALERPGEAAGTL